MQRNKLYQQALERLEAHHRGMQWDEDSASEHLECQCFDLEAGHWCSELLRAGKSLEEICSLVAEMFIGTDPPSEPVRFFAQMLDTAVAGGLYDVEDSGAERELAEAKFRDLRVRTLEDLETANDLASDAVERCAKQADAHTVTVLSELVYAAIWWHSREEDDGKRQCLEEALGKVALHVFHEGGAEEARIFVDSLQVEFERHEHTCTADTAKLVFARGIFTGKCECGAPGCRVYVERSGTTIGHRCGPCWDKDIAGFDRLQADAQELRDSGVNDRMVQRVMCARVDRGEYA
jgi:hypothetical protein